MKILIIHQYFAAPNESGGTRHYELSRHLVGQGHEVTIVASDLSYHSGQRVTVRARLLTRQDLDGIRLFRAYTYASLHKSFLWRVVSLLSFMCTSFWAAWRAGKVDVVMSTTPPIFQPLAAWLVALLRRRPFLLEVRDLWPEFAIAMGVISNPTLIWLARRLESFLYARATHILVNSPAYRDYLVARGIKPHKISVVPNGVDPAMFPPGVDGGRIRDEYGLDGRFVVTYAGALGQANDIGTLLAAAERLKDDPGVHFLLVGGGKEKENLRRQVHERQLTNVTIDDPRPKADMPALFAASDACVAILQDIPMFRTTYPNKVFDYMAAGRPIVLAIDGVIRQVVEKAHGGIFVPPGNEVALADAVRHLRDHRSEAEAMGRQGREYVCRHFNRHKQAVDFEKLLSALAAQKTCRVGQQTHQELTNPVSVGLRGLDPPYDGFYRRYGKRLFDLALTIPAIVVLGPIMLLVAIAVRLSMGSPVIFKEERAGMAGKPFDLCKFRSMLNTKDEQGRLLPDSRRRTRTGDLIRRLSLDELAQLWNVLVGEMSLVGPRPLVTRYLPRYSPQQARRHEVRPGITGWAQVNGRNVIGWERKFEYDVWYVDHVSLRLDLKILARTVVKVLSRRDMQPEPEFMGSPSSCP
jgi:lipopolysaccharide/colanic/teichoic acid biosynthesis glycosyltransferase/glycosyltransferase involved in cell wall biosynthesis